MPDTTASRASATVVPDSGSTISEVARDPLHIMITIAKDDVLSDADKSRLIGVAQNKFKHRRAMAYVALTAIVVSLVLLFVAAFIDGLSAPCPKDQVCTGILASIEKNQTLIAWIEGFLTSIVAAYYGISAWRPAS